VEAGRCSLPCELGDLERSWAYFRRTELHNLSAVDATSFAITKRAGIRIAYTFDRHFAAVGFQDGDVGRDAWA
jgi:predicted nucleic acid-binding protein